MKSINRIITNICSSKLTESKEFYTSLFDLKISFESEWFIHLVSPHSQLEIGIIDRENDLVPKNVRNSVNGIYITLVIDDVDELFEIAKLKGYMIQEEPKNTFYGQRRLLLLDPNGVVIDVSSVI